MLRTLDRLIFFSRRILDMTIDAAPLRLLRWVLMVMLVFSIAWAWATGKMMSEVGPDVYERVSQFVVWAKANPAPAVMAGFFVGWLSLLFISACIGGRKR